MMNDAKRIPYGVSNFVEVVEQNQYYVDKTMYLPLLEKQPSSFVWRVCRIQHFMACSCEPSRKKKNFKNASVIYG